MLGLQPGAQHLCALDEILQATDIGGLFGGFIQPELRASRRLLCLAGGFAVALHALADALAGQRRRVGVGDHDEDARQAPSAVGLHTGPADGLHGFQRALVAHPQLLELPAASCRRRATRAR